MFRAFRALISATCTESGVRKEKKRWGACAQCDKSKTNRVTKRRDVRCQASHQFVCGLLRRFPSDCLITQFIRASSIHPLARNLALARWYREKKQDEERGREAHDVGAQPAPGRVHLHHPPRPCTVTHLVVGLPPQRSVGASSTVSA